MSTPSKNISDYTSDEVRAMCKAWFDGSSPKTRPNGMHVFIVLDSGLHESSFGTKLTTKGAWGFWHDQFKVLLDDPRVSTHAEAFQSCEFTVKEVG